jgi:hypothetical protein
MEAGLHITAKSEVTCVFRAYLKPLCLMGTQKHAGVYLTTKGGVNAPSSTVKAAGEEVF